MMEDLFKERKEKLNLFKALLPKTKEAPKPAQNNVPEGLYTKCPDCQRDMLSQQMKANLYVCPECGCHMRVTAWDRIEMLVDPESFREIRPKLRTKNALGFPGYNQKLYHLEKATGLNDSVVTGLARIEGHRVVLGVMDCRFMMGSMGSVAGEKITRAIEYATRKGLPVIMFCASGGARMQEGNHFPDADGQNQQRRCPAQCRRSFVYLVFYRSNYRRGYGQLCFSGGHCPSGAESSHWFCGASGY